MNATRIDSYWAVWWGMLVVIVLGTEVLALVRRGAGDTLSEMVWALLRLPGWGTLILFQLLAFQLWLIVHFAMRGRF